jgi:hypothetical protein
LDVISESGHAASNLQSKKLLLVGLFVDAYFHQACIYPKPFKIHVDPIGFAGGQSGQELAQLGEVS